MRAVARVVSLVTLSALVGCKPSLEVPPGAIITCAATEECPEGLVCSPAGRCVSTDGLDATPPDLAAPPVVEPAVGKAGTTFAIRLRATEPLARPPRVTLALATPAVLACASADDGHRCEYTATGEENGGLGGNIAFDVALDDAAGNSATRLAVATLQLDFTPPSLAAKSVAPAVARLGSELQLFFTASEPVVGELVATVSPPLDDGGEPRATFPLARDDGTLNYRLSHTVTAADPEGAVAFAVTLVDGAGNRGEALAVGSVTIDRTLPAVSGVTVTPARIDATGTVTVTADVTKALPPGGLVATVGGWPLVCGPRQATSPHFTCTRDMVGDELPAGTEAAQAVLVQATDAAGNTASGSGGVVFDFKPPAVASAGVAYTPASSNPLGLVSRAGAGTKITVTIVADEALATGAPPTLAASRGTDSLSFSLVAGSFTGAGATFEAVVPAGAADGAWVPTLAFADLAGNVNAAATFAAPAILVKTSPPVLTVDQSQVIYVRSPWGNAADEVLSSGFTLPAGPYFALAPPDPLAASEALPASTFSLAGGAPARIRIFADAGLASLVGSAAPLADGRWPRLRLANLDTPVVFATALDEAGNESAPVKLEHAEWVATPNAPAFGQSPHRITATEHVAPTLTQDEVPASAAPAGGTDGAAVIARARAAWREHTPSSVTPGPRSQHAMAYDARRGRVVLFGGFDTWEWDGARWIDPRPVVKPAGRYNTAIAYDASRGRIVLFGGTALLGSAQLADTWEWDGTNWVERTPATGNPGITAGHSLAYDAARGRVVLFGGSLQQAIWEWDGAAWTSRTPAGASPPRRGAAAMVYDSARGRIVLFGGMGATTWLQDTWEWDGTSWTDRTSAAKPGPRQWHAMAYDEARRRTVLFGGNYGSTLGDTWEWDGTTWVEKSPVGAKPSPRFSHAMAYDAARGRVLLYGGGGFAGGGTDTWEWDGTAWVDRRSTGTSPPARQETAMAFDAARGRAVLFGGRAFSTAFQDTWEWDGAAWSDRTPAGARPAARKNHALAYDGARGRVVLFGGLAGPGDTWEWDGASWVDRTPAGAKPVGRLQPALAFDSARNRVVLFGGHDGTISARQDTWEWDGTSWVDRTPAGAKPPARYAHAMAFDAARGRIVLFGGWAGTTRLQDTWEWDGTSWLEKAPTGPLPSARDGHGLVYDTARRRVVLFGGEERSYSDFRGDTWEWDGAAWFERTSAGPRPSGRGHHAMAWDAARSRLVLFGGTDGAHRSDTWEWESTPERASALQFTVSFGAADLAAIAITGLRVRAACGGRFETSGAGAALFGWASGVPDAAFGGWVPLRANAVAAAVVPPYLPAWPATLLDRSTASPDQARRFLLARDRLVAVQCRPAGPAGSGSDDGAVAMDYAELRVRYRP